MLLVSTSESLTYTLAVICNVLLLVLFYRKGQHIHASYVEKILLRFRQDQYAILEKEGTLCGGVITHQKMIANQLHIRYAYRVPAAAGGGADQVACLKDFQVPEGVQFKNQKIVIVVVSPRYPAYGVESTILQNTRHGDFNKDSVNAAFLLCCDVHFPWEFADFGRFSFAWHLSCF